MLSHNYDILIKKLSEQDGGGWLAIVPDLPGCISDGETRAEAAANCEVAIADWLEMAQMDGEELPQVGNAKERVTRQLEAIFQDIMTHLESEAREKKELQSELRQLRELWHSVIFGNIEHKTTQTKNHL